MKWGVLEPDFKKHDESRLFQEVSPVAALKLCFAKNQNFVLCTNECWTEIMEHLSPHRVEMGGLLIGKLYQNQESDRFVSRCERIVPAISHESSAVSLKMDSTIWTEANNSLNDEECVIGWYHSHPNLGAFFSGTDRYNQKANFSSPFHVGLVVDHIRHEWAVFTGKHSEELPACNFLFESCNVRL